MRFCMLLLCIIFSNISLAQIKDTSSSRFKYGLQFGLSLTDLVTSPNTIEPRASFMAGIHFNYRWNNQWALQTELNYVRRGEMERNIDTSTGSRLENRILLDYLEVPFLVKKTIYQGLSLEVGPYLAVLTKAEQKKLMDTQMQVFDIQEELKKIDAGGMIGITYTTQWDFFMGFRYAQGVTEVFENQNDFSESYHSQFQFYFGYLF